MAEGLERIGLVASGDVLQASSAEGKKLLAGLKEQNPLFAQLDGAPNAHLVLFDLTLAGQESRHQGPMRYQLATAGLERAMPSLIAKPIHVTEDYDGHFDRDEEPKVVGVFLGSMKVDNGDGTETLRAIGTLFEQDFPADVEFIKANRKKLGASYEIAYAASDTKQVRADLTEISEYDFTGGAILLKSAAAHPDTKVLVAEQEPTGGKHMSKPKDGALAGIPEEMQGTVKALIASAVAEITDRAEVAELQSTIAASQAEIAKLSESAASAAKTISEVTASREQLQAEFDKLKSELEALQVTHATLTVERDTVKTELETVRAEAEKRELAEKVEAQWQKIQADYNHPDEAKEELLPLVEKMVAGKEPITVEEGQKLFAAGRSSESKERKRVPLHAGAGNPGEVSREELAKNFPLVFAPRSVR